MRGTKVDERNYISLISATANGLCAIPAELQKSFSVADSENGFTEIQEGERGRWWRCY